MATRRCRCRWCGVGRVPSRARSSSPTWCCAPRRTPRRPGGLRSSSARSCSAVATRCRDTRCRPRSASCGSWVLRGPARWCVSMRNVLVTGGSRGLGLGIARRLTAAGYRVIAVARKESPQLTSAMEEAEGAHPGSLRFVACDLAEIDDLPALVTTVRKDVGPIYGLVNNAAVGFDGVLALMPTSQIAQLVRVNTLAPIVLTKYVVRAMLADGGGRIVNVASIVGFTGYRGLSVYGATKASLLGFTLAGAGSGGHGGDRECGRARLSDTEMTQGLDGVQREQIARRSALRRLPDIDDVAGAVEFLLGDNANSITGSVLTVDAGSTA